jgi:lipid-binding SYLF domain-containing protein
MQMASAGVGLGLGAKNYQTVFVFHTQKAIYDFTKTGLDMSGHADAAAKIGEKGAAYTGAADVIPGVRVYQMTENGLMAQAMLQGTKYWPDNELNNGRINARGVQTTPPANTNGNVQVDSYDYGSGTTGVSGIQPEPVTRDDLNR